MSAHDFEFTSIDGKPLKLSQFAGHPVLVVNTASQCGLTPQYKGLEALWQKYRDRGLVVLGVPSNDFGAQEPGSEAEIKNFCSTNYKVTFPMTSKYPVIGAQAHPLYKWVVGQAGEAAAPRWNFHKYLIGPKGELAGTFASKTAPDDAALTGAIETALAG
ncbi:MAG TPA: glutathione peroxidase [Micropepsaceae bacterium]|nr:glutathione peroxidase [Micropepsaceae bacterium]